MQNKISDWTFDSDKIADNFDDHVREQLPWYDLATNIVSHLARHFIIKNGVAYDIGAATGNISKAISKTAFERNCKIYSIENSTQMASKFNGYGDLLKIDVSDVSFKPSCFTVSFLTLIFIHPVDRYLLIEKIVSSLICGGAFCFFEKIIPEDHYIGVISDRLALSEKLRIGCSSDSILEKELSLSGIQIPMSKKELIKYTPLEIFRFGNFTGQVIIKGHVPDN